MAVYIEYVIIDNLVIDFLLLTLSTRVCRVSTNRLKILFGACLGTAFAVAFPLINIHGALLFLLKIMVGELMVFVSARFKSPTEFLKTFVVFLVLTFSSGGALIGVCFLINGGFCEINGTFSFSILQNLPLGAIVFGVSACLFAVYKTVFYFRKKADVTCFEREVLLFDNGKSVRLLALLDSGNCLYDKRSGKPISVIGKGVANKLIDSGALLLRACHYVRCASVSGEGKMLVFEIDRLVIYFDGKRNIIDNAMIGISPSGDLNGVDLLLHSALC